METWLANMLHIEEHNFEYALGRKTYSLGMNHYGDLTSDEFAKTYNGFLNSKKEMLPSHYKIQNLAILSSSWEDHVSQMLLSDVLYKAILYIQLWYHIWYYHHFKLNEKVYR